MVVRFLVGFSVFNGGGGRAQPPPGVPGVATPPDPGTVLTITLAVIASIVAFVILKFLSAGALIEGVRRARRNGPLKGLAYASVGTVSLALLSPIGWIVSAVMP